MRVLVTGATGFIGYHVAKRLRSEGHAVRALVRNKDKAAQVLGPLGILEDDWVVGDMIDGDAVGRAIEGCDCVVHAAANVSVTGDPKDLSANLRGTETVIGRHPDCGIQLDSNMVSRHHAEVIFDGQKHYLKDLGSGNGTFLNGKKVEGQLPLRHSDRIKLGPILLRFEQDSSDHPVDFPSSMGSFSSSGSRPASRCGSRPKSQS